MSERSALVLGVTGLIGQNALQILLSDDRYGQVTAFSRRPLEITHPKLKVHVVNFEALSDFERHLVGDDLFCCLGSTIKNAGSQEEFKRIDHDLILTLAESALRNGVSHFLLVSSLGAHPKSLSFYSRIKGLTEQDLIKLGFKFTSIFRPSLLLGVRKESRPLETLARKFSLGFSGFLIGAARRFRPVEAKVVARAMVEIGCRNEPGLHIYESDEIQKIGG